MQGKTNKKNEIERWARAIAKQESPLHLFDESCSVAILRGVELADKGEGYIFVSMRRAVVRFLIEERREENIEEAWEPEPTRPTDEHALILEDLNALYRATEGLDRKKLAFLAAFVKAILDDEDGPIAAASRECGFTKNNGGRILQSLRRRIEHGQKEKEAFGGLRQVRSARDLYKLLHRRARRK